MLALCSVSVCVFQLADIDSIFIITQRLCSYLTSVSRHTCHSVNAINELVHSGYCHYKTHLRYFVPVKNLYTLLIREISVHSFDPQPKRQFIDTLGIFPARLSPSRKFGIIVKAKVHGLAASSGVSLRARNHRSLTPCVSK